MARKSAGSGEFHRLGAAEAAAAIAAGKLTSEALVADCLARIEARERDIHAWAFVDPDLALAQARACDSAASPRGPLHGVPVGVKDVIDTADMPTEYGSSLYRGHRPVEDSRCVAQLRAAGAVILGKTATTEFASPVPAGVRNPHDPARTPGVSSSGSAAAVADFMTPLANGTQTGGSVILPAAFCGVVGYKASLDGFDRTGIAMLKPTLDTLGYFARAVADIALIRSALSGETVPGAPAAMRVGLCRTAAWDDAEPCMQQAIEDTTSALSDAGHEVVEVALPPELDGIEDVFRVISNFEGRRATPHRIRESSGSLNHWMRAMLESDWTESQYAEALAAASAARMSLETVYAATPVLLTPATAGEAPADLESVSVSTFNRLWTLLHGPTVTLPAATGPNGMPVGIQLAAPPGADALLIATAAAIETILAGQRS